MGNYLRGDQLAPHSIEAEEAVLGSILINPDALFEVLPFLSGDDFFIVRHGWIWEAMIAISERREPIDYLMVVSELEQAGRLAEIGGAAYVLELVNKTPSALNVDGYGRVVERMAIRRKLIGAAETVARVAHSDENDIQEVMRKSERAVLDVVALRKSTRITAAQADERIVANENYDKTLVTEIEEFDRATDYQVKYGRSLHIEGASGHFKTTLAVELLADWALMGHTCLYVSMENPVEDIKTQMNNYVAWSRRVTVNDAKSMLSRCRLEFLSERQHAKDIEAHVLAMGYGWNSRVIVAVDTIQKLIDCNGRNGRDTSSVAAGSAALDGARLNTGALFVILCQQYLPTNPSYLNIEQLRPGRSNVKDAKAIFEDARIMVGTYYADYWRHEFGSKFVDSECGENEILLKCSKNTFGNVFREKFVKLAVIPSIPAVVSPSRLKTPVQQTFAAASHPGNGDGR